MLDAHQRLDDGRVFGVVRHDLACQPERLEGVCPAAAISLLLTIKDREERKSILVKIRGRDGTDLAGVPEGGFLLDFAY